MRRRQLVEDYRLVLRRTVRDIGFGAPETELPATKREIADAIRDSLQRGETSLHRDVLRDAYASLAMFCDDETFTLVRAGKEGLSVVGNDVDDETRERITRAFVIRNRLLQGRVMLERQFDEIVAEIDRRKAAEAAAAEEKETSQPDGPDNSRRADTDTGPASESS